MKAIESIKAFLRNPGDCEVPCFLGIIPGNTTFNEAKIILSQLGVELFSTTVNNKDFYSFSIPCLKPF